VPWWSWLILAVLLAGLVLLAVLVYRVTEVRRAGTPVILRRLPAAADQGWRHGSVHYNDYSLVYYRLSSLRIGPTAVLPRRRLEIVGRRHPEGTELEIMEPDTVIVHLTVNAPGGKKLPPSRAGERAADYEVALDRDLLTGLLSWIEARSPSRARWRRAA